MNKYDDGQYRRISKATAKKLFEQGETIRIVPCKYRPDNMYNALDFNREQWERDNMEQGKRVLASWCFDNYCIRWTYYNGSYEQGYYPAFYIKS